MDYGLDGEPQNLVLLKGLTRSRARVLYDIAHAACQIGNVAVDLNHSALFPLGRNELMSLGVVGDNGLAWLQPVSRNNTPNTYLHDYQYSGGNGRNWRISAALEVQANPGLGAEQVWDSIRDLFRIIHWDYEDSIKVLPAEQLEIYGRELRYLNEGIIDTILSGSENHINTRAQIVPNIQPCLDMDGQPFFTPVADFVSLEYVRGVGFLQVKKIRFDLTKVGFLAHSSTKQESYVNAYAYTSVTSNVKELLTLVAATEDRGGAQNTAISFTDYIVKLDSWSNHYAVRSSQFGQSVFTSLINPVLASSEVLDIMLDAIV